MRAIQQAICGTVPKIGLSYGINCQTRFVGLILIISLLFTFILSEACQFIIIRPRRSRSTAAYSRQTFPWTICRSVRASVGRSVCLVHCGKTVDRIRMPFGIIGRTGPEMRQVVGFGDRSTGRDPFGGEFGARHCNQWGLYGVCVRQHRDAALFPNYFGQTCSHHVTSSIFILQIV